MAEALVRSRIPKSEAVTIDSVKEGSSYAEVMKRVIATVNLQDIGVTVNKVRRTKTGTILLEVTGKDEATRLSDNMQSAVGEIARVSRPSRRTLVLILDIPDWLEEEEVRKGLIEAEQDLVVAEIAIRQNVGGGRIASFMTTMETAARLADRQTIRIGWGPCQV